MPHPVTRRTALLGPLAALLASCGDDEAAQRKAFAAFLQSRILDKPGVHVARPTPDEAKSWGEYAKHYSVITGFNDELSQRVSKPMQAAVQRGAVRSIDDLLTRRADLVEIRSGMRDLGAELDRQFAAAEAARAALTQPADLKTVYDAAYERDVAGPARAFKEVFPLTDASLAAALDLADFIAQHRSAVQVQGATVQVADPALLRDFNARLATMQAAGSSVQAAQRRLQTMITGG